MEKCELCGCVCHCSLNTSCMCECPRCLHGDQPISDETTDRETGKE